MSHCSHLKALIKKNLLVYKNTLILTTIEILSPILIIFLFWKLRTLFKIVNNAIEDDSYYYIDNYFYITNEFIFDEDYYFIPYYGYCFNTNKYIAIIGEEFLEKYLNSYDIYNTDLYRHYSSIDELNKYIESAEYGTDDYSNPEICFGISFEHIKNKYNIKLHFFASSYDFHYIGIPPASTEISNQFATQPDFDSFNIYCYRGFLFTLKLIYDNILKLETGNPWAEIIFTVVPQKYEKYVYDSFGEFYNFILGFFIIIAYALPLSINIYRLVKEKETRIKECMKIMGLRESTYFFSYFILYLFINLVYSICNTFLLNKGMRYIEKLYLFIFFFLYGLVIYSLIYFFQSFLEKTRLAIIVSLLIYCLMYFFSFCVDSNVVSRPSKIIFCIIFPPITMQLGLNTFSFFETNFNDFKGRVFMKYKQFSIFDMYILFLVNFFLYMFLGFYIQNIISHEFGIKKNWYFLFTKNYWGYEADSSKKKKLKVYNNRTNKEIKLQNVIQTKNDLNSNNNKNFSINNKKDLDKTGINLLNNSKINIINSTILNEKNTIINNKEKDNLFNDNNYDDNDFFENNNKYKENKPEDILQINDIQKIFEDKKVALNGVSFNLYRNEIFALLGHNGAGKSTLINILTGLYQCTSGSAIYDSNNILTPEGIEQFRNVLGICPQYDILFNELTVEEHLKLFCVFKSIESSLIEKEISKVINDFGLKEKRFTKVKNLSGGQKRKLSISIALVGGSSVVFLDEPTSGMDITSRRNLWNVLKRCLNGKIIILTTHYMEEAAVLGNRIGILSEGNMKCIGSPLFLIEKYGKNINLNITKNKEADNDKIINFIKSNFDKKNIKYEIFNEEILFKIKKDNNFNGKESFINLDNNLESLNIKSYSISMSTLEDVFINISEIVKRKKMSKEEYEKEENEKMEKREKNNKILYDNSNYHEKYSICSKICRDTKISLKKRIMQIYRDKKTFFLEILCPILLTLIGCIVGSIDILEKNIIIPLHLNQVTNDSQIIYYSSEHAINNDTILKEIFSKYSSENKSNINFEYININKTYRGEREIYFMKEIYNKKYIKNKIKNNYVGYYFIIINNTCQEYEFTYFPDIVSKKTTPIYVNYLLNNLVRYASKNENLEIEIISEPLPYTRKEKLEKQDRSKIIILFFISISFSLIPANFITIIIKERENNSKHLQIISGISLFSYWLNNYIFELVKYYIIGGICILIIYLFDFYKKYLIFLYIEYGPAMVSFTYFFSFIFSSEDKGQTCILLVNLLFGTLGGSAVLIMRYEDDLKNKAKTLAYILRIIPSFCFSYGYNLLLNEEDLDFFGNHFYILDMENLKSDFIYLSIESIIYLLFFIIIENSNKLFLACYITSKKSIKNKMKIEINSNENNNCNNISIPDNINDTFVKNEIIKAKNPYNKKKYAIKIQSLIKTFYGGPFGFKIFNKCFKPTKAVRNISFCLEYGECFGLLGINGAGKTTTFKCLSNEIFPTYGNIYIDKKNINKDFQNVRSLIGYCPQFDAIFNFLTVYENLEFYGLIKGAKISKLKDIINALIEEINLINFKNKVAGSLSGGNRRKLSVAIALICNPPIILLDEPSTGMDPEARRFMWGVIHRVSLNQKKSTIIMTSHSMEEAETLCKRIGILVDGQFKCLSTIDEIKEKYGYGYEINLQVKKPNIIVLYEMYKVRNEDKNKEIYYNCLEECLKLYKFEKYIKFIQKDLFGAKIVEECELYGKINFNKILYWIYYLNNFFNFVNIILENYTEVYCIDYSENNFIIKIKKEKNKSIGFLFGLIEDNKQKYNIEQYDLRLTSLEQIFNKFAREKEQASNNDNFSINIEMNKEFIDTIVI